MLSDHQKPVIFLAFANDRNDQSRYLRNLPEELRRVRERLSVVEDEGLCEVVVRTNATVNELLDVFQDRRYRNRIAIFHFGGHAGGYQLLAESIAGSPELVHADGLADFLGQQNGLQLVFLNGCSTEPQVEGLLEANIPAVIATSEFIEDRMAMELSARFYAGLAGGTSIETAYKEAVAAVKTTQGTERKSDGPIEISTRNFIVPKTSTHDRWPWQLYVGEGSDIVKSWNIPEASGDSLFGLPELEKYDLPPSPFRHLQWFDEDDAELFFGRGREIRALYEMVTSEDHAPVVLFYGQTGVGKSSLLASGLLPRLKRTYKELYVRQEIELGLAGTLAHGLGIRTPSEATAEMIKKAWLWHEQNENKPLVLVLDQVEEIFTRLSPEQLTEHLQQFLDVLNHVFMQRESRPQGKLILGFRKEWLPDIEAACTDARLFFSKFFLKRLDRNGTIEAIQGVSKSERLKQFYRLRIEEGLPAIIADDLLEDRDSPLAPTLQILLTKMWQIARQADLYEPEFNTELYQSLKKRGILLSDFLDEQLNDIKQRHPELSKNGFVLDLLARHTTQLGTAATCTLNDLYDLYDHQKKKLPILLKEFQELFLIVPVEQQVNGLTEEATRLAHDTLAPLIRKMYRNSDRAGQRALRILENRAVEWEDGNVGAPLDETDLQLVELGQPGMHAWSYDEQRLVEASRKARAQRQRRRGWVRMGAMAAVVLIAMLAGYGWIQQGIAKKESKESARQAEIAEQKAQEALDAQQLAEERQAEALQQQLRAEANAEEARRQEAQAKENEEEALRQQSIAEANEAEARRQEQEAARQQKIAEDNARRAEEQRQIADEQRAIAEQRTVEVNQQRRRTLGLALANKAALRLSNDDPETAALLAREAHHFNRESTGEFVNEVYDALRRSLNAIDNGSGGPQLIGPSHNDWVRTVAYSPQGEWVASAGSDGNVYMWSAQKSNPEDVLKLAHKNVIRDLQFNPAGNLLATLADDKKLRIWENQNNQFEEIRDFPIEGRVVRGLAFRPDGSHIALASEGEEVRILPITGSESNRPAIPLKTRDNTVQTLAFSQDGQWLVGGDRSGNLQVWSWDNPTGEPQVLQAHRGAIRSVAFSTEYLATGGEDTRVRLWKINGAGQLENVDMLRGHTGPVNTVAFNAAGTQLATGSADQTVRIWQIDRIKESPIVLKEHSSWIESVSFSADGQSLVSGSADRTVRVWRINPETLANEICAKLNKRLTEEEWESFAPKITYPNSCSPVLSPDQVTAESGGF